MNELNTGQLSLFDSSEETKAPTENTKTPADDWNEDSAKHALDELFNATYAYRSSNKYMELMRFIGQFRFYSPYNAMLIYIQRPGARFVATPTRWDRDYGRDVMPSANPIVILRPMGPVMFVFDVSDTEPGPNARPIPTDVDRPFEVQGGIIGNELERTLENAKRDGIRVHNQQIGSQGAGSIQSVSKQHLPPLQFYIGEYKDGNPKYKEIPVRYELLLSEQLSREAKYATLVHELAHLYCGHLGTPNIKWWPNRYGLSHAAVEFEAESVAFLVCSRVQIENRSASYLSNYVKDNKNPTKISLECVMKATGLIEKMGKKRLPARKS